MQDTGKAVLRQPVLLEWHGELKSTSMPIQNVQAAMHDDLTQLGTSATASMSTANTGAVPAHMSAAATGDISVPVYTAVIDVASTTTAIPETPQFHNFMNQVPAGMLLATVTVQTRTCAMSNEGGTGSLAVGTPDGLTTLHGRLDKFSKQADFATIVTAQLQAELKTRRTKEAADRTATEEATVAARSKEAFHFKFQCQQRWDFGKDNRDVGHLLELAAFCVAVSVTQC